MIKNKVEQLNNPYGQVTYETFRARRQAFVDKTGIIESLDDEGMTPYPVLLRPRRFGKSTFIQMLKCFYDISYKDRYDKIFSGKKIYAVNLADHNTYHVINFDFSKSTPIISPDKSFALFYDELTLINVDLKTKKIKWYKNFQKSEKISNVQINPDNQISFIK